MKEPSDSNLMPWPNKRSVIRLKQGTALPTTGIGTGYLLFLIYGIIVWDRGLTEVLKIPSAYLLLIIPTVMQFSYKDFVLKEEDPENYYYVYRVLFLFRFRKKFRFTDFSSVVIRVVNKSYRVKQGLVPAIASNEGTHSEKYLALVGYINKSEKIEICKGKQDELESIIKNQLIPLGVPVFVGAPKAGYEYRTK